MGILEGLSYDTITRVVADKTENLTGRDHYAQLRALAEELEGLADTAPRNQVANLRRMQADVLTAADNAREYHEHQPGG